MNLDFRGDHLIFRITNGGSLVTENPKGGSEEESRRGYNSNLLGN